MRAALLGVAAAFALFAIPSAAAHTTVSTNDGKYFVTVGHLNEPISTFTKTGLDLIIRANASGARGPGISGAHLTLNATLLAPGGEELTHPLRAQFGTVGSYSFTEPYYLTQTGVYHLRLTGRVNSTPVDFPSLVVGSESPIPAIEGLTFPDDSVNMLQLESQLRTLQAEYAALQTRVAHLEATTNSSNQGAAPGLDPLVITALVALVGVFLARRKP